MTEEPPTFIATAGIGKEPKLGRPLRILGRAQGFALGTWGIAQAPP